MKNKEPMNAAGKANFPDILRCWRCGAEFSSIEGITIAHGMVMQKVRCPICKDNIRSLRPFTVAHRVAFAVGIGIVLAGSGAVPISLHEGYALYSPAAKRGGQQANGRRE